MTATPPRPGYVREGARPLGEGMHGEGWWSVGDEDRDHLFWMHEPSRRVVSIENHPRSACKSLPALPGEPADPSAAGYLVMCRKHDEHGNPCEGTGFWIESFGKAVRHARAVRASIIAEQPSAASKGT